MKEIFLLDSFEENSQLFDTDWKDTAKKYLHDHSFKCYKHKDFYVYGFGFHTNDSEVMRFFFDLIKRCDVLLVNLESIKTSNSLSDEILFAYLNDIPIIGFIETENILSEDEIINLIHPWKYLQINRIETGKNALLYAMDYIKNYY